MKCCSEIWKEKIDLYDDNLLSNTESTEVEDHVKTCSLCAEYLAEKQLTISVIRALPKESVSKEFDEKINYRINRIQSELKNPIFHYYELFAVVFIVLIGVITFIGFHLFDDTDKSEADISKPKSIQESSLELPDK